LSIATLIAALAGFAGFFGVAGVGAEVTGRARRKAPRRSGDARVPTRAHVVLEWLGRLVASAPPIRGLPVSGDLEARLLAAGEPAGLGMREWIALKLTCAVLGGLVAALGGAGLPPRIAALAIVAGPVAGFAAPDFWLARLSRQRIEGALRELPDMLDLLRVTVEAGMPPARAIGMVAAEFRGTLAREWGRVAAEIELGVGQDEAMTGLRARLPADEIGSLVEALVRSRRHGVPLGKALELQASKARESRRRQIREQAAKAGPKIQLVVALLLVPAVLLIVAAGLLVELQRSGLFLST
jgi:tight adherence protein C